ncbi:neuropeptide FF receptor 1-like [Mercenaria mercenaria]|uniref:neuropeptide FF receptor 1-like n=1 Tax=Mercenaria mercenaria TaxID=6596 RepID=UPI00234EEF9E|nr:neuropeptide FF receptor 1-like [Mercenaria mercenaria]
MNNDTNDPGCDPDAQSNPEEDQPKIVIHIAMGMVTLLSVCGILGNALAIFVFSRQKNKLSSTVFILTLAVTDFISSLVTMPYTVVIELMYYNIGYDFPCKLYQFMKTTTIPFSAFVMVAIALDRYLCIVYPFKHIMTVRRAKIIVCILVMLAFIIGILASLMIGTYHYPATIESNNCTNRTNKSVLTYSDIEDDFINTMNNSIIVDSNQSKQLINTGVCLPSYLILDKSFMLTYQKIYSALFGVCAVLVIILYCLTYRSVLVHRNKRLNVSNKCCGMLTSTMTDDTHEHTEFTTLHKDDHSPIVNGQERESCMQDKFRERLGTNDSSAKSPGGRNVKADSEVQVGPGGISRAKLKKLRVANIKTALMLSIVAFMYIVAFTPAWMMALRVLDMNVIVYYLYFTYNVANPVIYAFLNNNFRTHLQAMFRCRKS